MPLTFPVWACSFRAHHLNGPYYIFFPHWIRSTSNPSPPLPLLLSFPRVAFLPPLYDYIHIFISYPFFLLLLLTMWKLNYLFISCFFFYNYRIGFSVWITMSQNPRYMFYDLCVFYFIFKGMYVFFDKLTTGIFICFNYLMFCEYGNELQK